MRRRSLLSAIVAVSVAGCTSAGDVGEETTTTTAESTRKVSVGGIETTLREIFMAETIRYYDSEADSVKYAEAENGWWVVSKLWAKNLTDKEIPVSDLNSVRLRAAGSEYVPLPEMPVDNVRPREGNYVLEYATESIPSANSGVIAGNTLTLYPLFDVPAAEDYTVVWRYQGKEYLLS